MEERSVRDGRMDKSLDEIAAEMSSGQRGGGGGGRDYEAREPAGAERHGKRSSAHRYAPYGQPSAGAGGAGAGSWRASDKNGGGGPADGGSGTKVFVANLKYSVTWQQLKDYMKKGKAAGAHAALVYLRWVCMCVDGLSRSFSWTCCQV